MEILARQLYFEDEKMSVAATVLDSGFWGQGRSKLFSGGPLTLGGICKRYHTTVAFATFLFPVVVRLFYYCTMQLHWIFLHCKKYVWEVLLDPVKFALILIH